MGDRSDPEFYSRENIRIEKALRDHNAKPLNDYCELKASAFYPAATHLYEQGEVPFVRCVDCIDYPLISKLQENDFERIPRSFIAENNSVQLIHKSEIVLTKVGTPCYASIVQDYDELALSRTVLGLVNIQGINPYYLMAFLRSHYGFSQLMRHREQTIQYQLTLDRVRAVQVYSGSEKLQKAVETIVLEYFSRLQEIQMRNRYAEQTLLHALGLENWQPPENLTYERKSADVFATGRLDAEHFQPKYDELYRQIKKTGIETRRLEEIILPVMNGFDCRDFVESGTPYIRVGDIKKGRIEIESAFQIPLTSDKIGKDISLHTGDVLFTRKGSFGNAAPVWDEAKHAVISSEIMLLRFSPEHKNAVLPEYLALFLNSMAGNIQAEKWAHGGAFYSIMQDDLGQFVIPLIPKPEQEALRDLIVKSEAARKQARFLLDAAKCAVEIAIEENEDAAMAFLNKSQRVSL